MDALRHQMLDPADLLRLVRRALSFFCSGHRSAALGTSMCDGMLAASALDILRFNFRVDTRSVRGASSVMTHVPFLQLTRRSMFATVCACHLRPRAVAMPRPFKAAAISLSDLAPAAWTS